MHSRGLVKGRLIFVIVAPSMVSATEGVELASLASMARDTLGEVANGDVRTETSSDACDGIDKALGGHSIVP